MDISAATRRASPSGSRPGVPAPHPLRPIAAFTIAVSLLVGLVAGLAIGYSWGRDETLSSCIDEPGPCMTCADGAAIGR